MNNHQCLFADNMEICEIEICGINLRIMAEDNSIVKIEFLSELSSEPKRDKSVALQEAITQLREYLEGRRKYFSVNYKMYGTEFQQLVWKQLLCIPYGETLSYGELAKRIGRPKAARAVGMANHVNPLPLLVPCHRIIGTDGSLTGYAGGLNIKKKLLLLEKSGKNNNST